MSEATDQQLLALVQQLQTRLDSAETEIAELRKRIDAEIPEDVVLAISAAVAAYLGNKGKVKAVHFRRHRTWAAQGRQAIQNHVRRL